MKKIEEYADYMEDEIKDACKYAKKALEFKDSDKEAAQVYFQNSIEELEHAHRFHKLAVATIKKLEDQGLTPEPWMIKEYERRHKRAIDAELEVKMLQAMYREM